MQKVIDFINTHTYDIFIPLTALALLRLGMCWAQLKKTAAIREKKGIYHAVREHYAEMGAWLGILPFCVLALIFPKVWYIWIALAVIGGAGGSLFEDALAQGADCLLTGEANHHHACDAKRLGLSYPTRCAISKMLKSVVKSSCSACCTRQRRR